jgi:hypothetical protein
MVMRRTHGWLNIFLKARNNQPVVVVNNLAPGRYYWSVQTIDTSFAGSPFAAEQLPSSALLLSAEHLLRACV